MADLVLGLCNDCKHSYHIGSWSMVGCDNPKRDKDVQTLYKGRIHSVKLKQTCSQHVPGTQKIGMRKSII